MLLKVEYAILFGISWLRLDEKREGEREKSELKEAAALARTKQ